MLISRQFPLCCLVLAAVMLAACGQKGPLFLPESNPPTATNSSQAESEDGENDETTP